MGSGTSASTTVKLLDVITSSCNSINTTFCQVTDAPPEIRKHQGILKTLPGVLRAFVESRTKLSPEPEHNSLLQDLVSGLADQSLATRQLIKNAGKALPSQSQLWAQGKWAPTDKNEVLGFFHSLKHRNTTLLHIMQLANFETSIDTKNDTAAIRISELDQGRSGTQLAPTKQLASLLANSEKPVDIHPDKNFSGDLGQFHIQVRFGPPIFRRWSKRGRECHVQGHRLQEYAASIALRSDSIFHGRASINFYFRYRFSWPVEFWRIIKLDWSRLISDNSPSFVAIRENNVNELRNLLKDGKVKTKDATSQGDTLLHLAARFKMPDIVTVLIEADADIHAANDFGETPLHLAIRAESFECSKLLLDTGADICRQNCYGGTPLHHFFNSVVKQIIHQYSEHIDLCTQDYRGMTVMHYVFWESSSGPEDVEVLRCSDSSFTMKDYQGRSNLHLTVSWGNTKLIEVLLDHADVATMSEKDHNGRTLLHYAMESKNVATIDKLFTRGHDELIKDNQGHNIIHHAIVHHNLRAVKRVLELSGNGDKLLTMVDSDQYTPLQLAQIHNQDSIVEYLWDKGPRHKPERLTPSILSDVPTKTLEVRRKGTRVSGFVIPLIILTLYFIWAMKTST